MIHVVLITRWYLIFHNCFSPQSKQMIKTILFKRGFINYVWFSQLHTVFWLNGIVVTPWFFSGFFHNSRHTSVYHTSVYHTDGFTNINFLWCFHHFWDVWIVLTEKEQRNRMVKKWKSKLCPLNLNLNLRYPGFSFSTTLALKRGA